MIDTPPHPTPAMRESPSALIRRGQLSVWHKVIGALLIIAQIFSGSFISYLSGKWDATVALLTDARERVKVLESWKEGTDKYLERMDGKLDRLLQKP